jgi:hypothetical protein
MASVVGQNEDEWALISVSQKRLNHGNSPEVRTQKTALLKRQFSRATGHETNLLASVTLNLIVGRNAWSIAKIHDFLAPTC